MWTPLGGFGRIDRFSGHFLPSLSCFIWLVLPVCVGD
jgi:hypothetical protein